MRSKIFAGFIGEENAWWREIQFFVPVMADANPKSWFKLVPVLAPSCFPLIKQDSSFWKDCIFCWCEIVPLDSYFLTLRVLNFKSSSNWTILAILVSILLKSVFSARLWRIERFNFKLTINRLKALIIIQLSIRILCLHNRQTIWSRRRDYNSVNKRWIGGGQDPINM